MSRPLVLLALLAVPMSLEAQAPAPRAPVTPPVAKVVPKVDTLHGEVRRDDYFWMRDRKNPEVIAYLEAENAWTDAKTRHLEPLREQLYGEMLGRIKETDQQVPTKRGPWLYYTRTEKGKSYPIFARKAVAGGAGAKEEVIFDQNEMAKGHRFYQLGGFQVSPDHGKLAVLVDTTGYEDFTLIVKDLATGTILPDRVDRLSFGLAWANDGKTIFYMTPDSAKRGSKVWRHELGTPNERDVLVFEEKDVLFNLGVSRTRSGGWIVVSSESFTSSEARVIPADRPAEPPRLVAARRPGVEYSVDHAGDRFLIVTNDGGAHNFKVVSAPEADPSPANWTEWRPHRADVFVEYVMPFREHVVVVERTGGMRQLVVTDAAGKGDRPVSFPEAAYGVFPGENPEFDTKLLRFTYSSLTTPSSVFDYDVATRRRTLLKEEEVLGGYDRTRYTVERLMATARDGTKVPVSLVYKGTLAKDGKRPLLLYAYGSYGATTEPTFNSNRLSLLDRGAVYAIAHVRGGQEMGRRWYDDGKMLKKMNTFFDFIDVADHLVKERYTSADRLVAHGGSAGGLLMGAVANLRPDLFKAVVADVPFVDVINTMLDASIPLTAQEWEQWGNPAVKEHYDYMKKYSPYDNVERKKYPWLLVMSGINDSRVAYWEPTKWVAKLRATKTDTNPLYLKMNMGGGHGGSSGRYDRLREQAFRYAFMLEAMGLTPAAVQ